MIAARVRLAALVVATAAAAAPVSAAGQFATDDPITRGQSISRGQYVFAAAGCAGCHTDVATKGPLLAGGRPLTTPFGTFYSPNITPDPGIGAWCQRRSKSTPLAGVKMHHLMRFSPALAVVPVVHRRDPRCFV